QLAYSVSIVICGFCSSNISITSFVPSFLVCSPHQAILNVTSSLSPSSDASLSLFDPSSLSDSTSLSFELFTSSSGSLSLPPHAANHMTITTPKIKSNVLFICFSPSFFVIAYNLIVTKLGKRLQYKKQV